MDNFKKKIFFYFERWININKKVAQRKKKR